MWWCMDNANERRNGRAGSYSCGHKTDGYREAMSALVETQVNTYRTSSILMADFWRPENLAEIGKAVGRRLPGLDLADAEKVFECPTEPVLDGEVVGGASMTDLMIRDARHQIAIEGKYTEYAWGPSETLNEWLSKKPTGSDIAKRRHIAKAWLDMIGRAGCTGICSLGELISECGEIGYQFLHRTASACHNATAHGVRKPTLVYQLIFDKDDAGQIAARDAFKASLRRWATLLKLKNMRFFVMEVPVTNGKRVEGRTAELDGRFRGCRGSVFTTLADESLYDFDFDGIVFADMLSRVCGTMELSDVRDALKAGCEVTILVRHAERPALDPADRTFGASLPLTERGWCTARQFGGMLAYALRPQSVAFYASNTFRTVQTACGMAIGLDESEKSAAIERKIRLSESLGSESPFFGPADERWALVAEGCGHDRMNDYFRSGLMRGYRPLHQAADEIELALNDMRADGDRLVVAVTHDINVAAFLAARSVIASFTEETWPGYLDAAVVVRRPDGCTEYGVLRWHKELEGLYLLPWEV